MMGTRDLGRKATVFAEGVQVLKAEWYYRPVFAQSPKVLVLSGNSRRAYMDDKFYRLQNDIRTHSFIGDAPVQYLGGR